MLNMYNKLATVGQNINRYPRSTNLHLLHAQLLLI